MPFFKSIATDFLFLLASSLDKLIETAFFHVILSYTSDFLQGLLNTSFFSFRSVDRQIFLEFRTSRKIPERGSSTRTLTTGIKLSTGNFGSDVSYIFRTSMEISYTKIIELHTQRTFLNVFVI